MDEGLIGGLYLVEAPGKAELARDAVLAEDPLIDVGPLLFPWKTEDGDILDWALPLVLPVTVDGLELTALVEPLLPENLLVPDCNVDEYGPIGEVTRLLEEANLFPFPANVAVIVGVMSVLVIVVAP